jgi:hypothetical protein
MRHIGANFFRQFKNKHLMDMFKRLCKETNQQKFNKQWQKLDELSRKKRSKDAEKPELHRMKQRLCVLCQQILHVLAEGLGQR